MQPGVLSDPGSEALLALGSVIAPIRELTTATLERCVQQLQGVAGTISASDDATRRLVIEVVSRAVVCPENAVVVGSLCARLVSDKKFKAALLSQCQSTFNTIGTDCWTIPSAIGLGSFIGSLHNEGIVPGKIVQTCMICSLCGNDVTRTHVPKPSAVVFACTLFISVEQAKGYAAVFGDKKKSWVVKKMMELKTQVDETTRERLIAALSIAEPQSNNKLNLSVTSLGSAAVSPTAKKANSFRHDPYAEAPVSSPAAPVPATPAFSGQGTPSVSSPGPYPQPTSPCSSGSPTVQVTREQHQMPYLPASSQPPPPPQPNEPQMRQPTQPLAPGGVLYPNPERRSSQPPYPHQQYPQQQQHYQQYPQQQQQQAHQQPQYPQYPLQQQQQYQPPDPPQLPVPGHPAAQSTAQPLTQEALAQWMAQTAPMQRQQQQQMQQVQARPQPYKLATLLHEAAVYSDQAAAEAAIAKHNVSVPQQMQSVQMPQQPEQPLPEQQRAISNIFEACRNKQEKRRLGNLIINKALQEGYNRSYGAARRKLARFCRVHGIGEADQMQLVEYLNDLFLAGKQYRGLCLKDFVEAPARILEDGLDKNAPAPGGMRSKRRGLRQGMFEDDEVDSVVSFGTVGTETWGDAISDDELDEIAGWYDDDATIGTRKSSHRSLSKFRLDSIPGSAPASELGDEPITPRSAAASVDLERCTTPHGNASICSRRSVNSRTSRASRSSSRGGLVYSTLPEDLTIDDRVKVKRVDGQEQAGTVRYIGFPQFADKGETYDGCWIGVALDEPVGNHDGTVNEERFFVAKPMHGVFVREDKIIRQPDGVEGTVFFYPQHLTKRLLRFDIRPEALRQYGFKSGDIIAATHSRYKGQGKAGTVIGVRHGLLFWRVDGEGITGACACRNTVQETLDTFKKKKYRRVGHEELTNYLPQLTTGSFPPVDTPGIPKLTGEDISPQAMAKVTHLVKPGDKWEGALVSPTPAEGYHAWIKKLWRKKKVEQAMGQQG